MTTAEKQILINSIAYHVGMLVLNRQHNDRAFNHHVMALIHELRAYETKATTRLVVDDLDDDEL